MERRPAEGGTCRGPRSLLDAVPYLRFHLHKFNVVPVWLLGVFVLVWLEWGGLDEMWLKVNLFNSIQKRVWVQVLTVRLRVQEQAR